MNNGAPLLQRACQDYSFGMCGCSAHDPHGRNKRRRRRLQRRREKHELQKAGIDE